MKNAILFISIFTSTLAMAKVEIDMPTINFGLAKVAATEVCVQGDYLVTKEEITFCSDSSRVWVSTGPRRSEGYFETVCNSQSTEVLSRSISYTAQRCTQWEGRRSENQCSRYENIIKTIPLSYTYGVYDVHTRRGERFKKLIETRSLTIPACN